MIQPGAFATDWMDQWWDDEIALLWNPAGAFTEAFDAPRTAHIVRETAWYALGLLRRDGDGDRLRADRAIAAVLDLQYDAPGEPWDGTFVRFPEWPAPGPGAVEWIDYDPNWRQFVGTTLAVIQDDVSLRPAQRDAVETAISRCVEAEPPDRVPPSYTNIALMRAWLDARRTGSADAYAASIVDGFDEHGAFAEYGSPTYYGIDLVALALWQRPTSPGPLRRWGARMEAALWEDIGRWYHAGLGNLCGPYTRSYGMDLHAYVATISLGVWSALGQEVAALPHLDGTFEHSHDLCLAPLLDHLGVRIPDVAAADLRGFRGERTIRQVISTEPSRVATGWLSPSIMAGGEASDAGWSARGQYHPATVHWRLPTGGTGWLRLLHRGPTSATASPGRLDITLRPHRRDGMQPAEWQSEPAPTERLNGRWTFSGLTVDVHEWDEGDTHRISLGLVTADP
jgi:hypothetical protein